MILKIIYDVGAVSILYLIYKIFYWNWMIFYFLLDLARVLSLSSINMYDKSLHIKNIYIIDVYTSIKII